MISESNANTFFVSAVLFSIYVQFCSWWESFIFFRFDPILADSNGALNI